MGNFRNDIDAYAEGSFYYEDAGNADEVNVYSIKGESGSIIISSAEIDIVIEGNDVSEFMERILIIGSSIGADSRKIISSVNEERASIVSILKEELGEMRNSISGLQSQIDDMKKNSSNGEDDGKI